MQFLHFRLDLLLCSSAVLLPLAAVADPVINEIRIDQPSTDTDEYFELLGAAGEPLDGLTYIVIGDGTGGSGVIESVTDLAGQSIPTDGVFWAARGTPTLGTPDFTTSLNFENSDNVTHLLVRGFTGANGDDLDTDDDGALDETPWNEIVDSVALVETVGSGDQIYSTTTVGPDGTFVPGQVYRLPNETGSWQIGAFDLGVDDTPGEPNQNGGGGEIGACGDEAELISTIQGNSDTSPMEGEVLAVEAIVVADFQGSDGLGGFFLQEETADQDGDDATSEGLFVYDNSCCDDVSVGDLVRVRGTVNEFFDLTELSSISDLRICTSGLPTTATPVTLPETTDGMLERYEGMLVSIGNPMLVAQNYFLGRYGQMTLNSPNDAGELGRVFVPTNQFEPESLEALALADENARRLLVLDDGSDVQNPDPAPYLGTPPAVIRGGDQVTGLVGVIDYGRISSGSSADASRDYRLQPTEEPTFTEMNLRTDAPDEVGGTVKVASFNVLNFFSTIDDGAPICGPDMDQGCRGADSADELTRQTDKLVSAILAIDADVIGLIEIENDDSISLQALVDAINAAARVGTYDYVYTGTIGGDAIKVAFVYKPATVGAIATAVLDDAVDPRALTAWNRPALAATFEHLASGETFTVVVNHFKSKGSPCDEIDDPDLGDGQGNCNQTRLSMAEAMVDWLATDPTGSGDPDFLIIGDLNSYAMEDPIWHLTDSGFENLISTHIGDTAYSYTFDGEVGYLDHALANASMAEQVTGVTEWHINTDEPSVLDYNVEFKPDPYGYYSPDAFRASDHDPVIIGLELGGASGSIPGDVDVDGDIDWRDRRMLRRALGSRVGDPNYIPEADLDSDGDVDRRDLWKWNILWLKSKKPRWSSYRH